MKAPRILLTSLLAVSVLAGLVHNEQDSEIGVADPAVESPKDSHHLNIHHVETEDNIPSSHLQLDHNEVGLVSQNQASDEDKPSYNAFLMSISMIVVSEIGDKTFLIAALMAMKHNRVLVFTAAFSSLAVMTVLSGIVGHALPTLISQRLTQFLASVLFVVFGAKLLREGLAMSKDVGVDEELAEVEEEIQSSDLNSRLDSAESGAAFDPRPNKRTWYHEFAGQMKDLASFVLSPIFIQVFVMTFLGEWGDRSQIATIAMAAGSEYWYVIMGAIVGHGLCTAAACVGGKLLAKRISMRTITLGGAIAFFVFAILYFYDAYYNTGAA